MKTIDIYKNIESIKIYNEVDIEINNVTIDTRELSVGDCYFGVKGERFDGNTFYK